LITSGHPVESKSISCHPVEDLGKIRFWDIGNFIFGVRNFFSTNPAVQANTRLPRTEN